MVYILEDTDMLDEKFIASSYNHLSLQRLQKLDSLKKSSARVDAAAVYLLLRYALKNEYGIDSAPEFIFKKNGKPYLRDNEKIFFNLSHSRNSCACILSDNETAVDIAEFRKISMNTAKYYCSPAELELIQSIEDQTERNRELVRLWAIKECYSKIDGSGLSMNFKTVESKKLDSIHIINGERYYAAYHSDKKQKLVKPVISQLL